MIMANRDDKISQQPAMQEITGIIIREATVADLPEILRHRRGMFEDMGFKDQAALDAMQATSERFIAKGIAEGFYKGWFVEDNAGQILAGGGIVMTMLPTHPRDPQPRRATILNMYTHPEHRRKGLARLLMQTMIDWCRSEGFASVSLHASDDGRHLYEQLGFQPTNEMRLWLK
jgi:GNAT superfamily N-acetyltransferase